MCVRLMRGYMCVLAAMNSKDDTLLRNSVFRMVERERRTRWWILLKKVRTKDKQS